MFVILLQKQLRVFFRTNQIEVLQSGIYEDTRKEKFKYLAEKRILDSYNFEYYKYYLHGSVELQHCSKNDKNMTLSKLMINIGPYQNYINISKNCLRLHYLR